MICTISNVDLIICCSIKHWHFERKQFIQCFHKEVSTCKNKCVHFIPDLFVRQTLVIFISSCQKYIKKIQMPLFQLRVIFFLIGFYKKHTIRDLFHVYLNRFEFHFLWLHINKTNKFCILIYNGRVPGMLGHIDKISF